MKTSISNTSELASNWPIEPMDSTDSDDIFQPDLLQKEKRPKPSLEKVNTWGKGANPHLHQIIVGALITALSTLLLYLTLPLYFSNRDVIAIINLGSAAIIPIYLTMMLDAQKLKDSATLFFAAIATGALVILQSNGPTTIILSYGLHSIIAFYILFVSSRSNFILESIARFWAGLVITLSIIVGVFSIMVN